MKKNLIKNSIIVVIIASLAMQSIIIDFKTVTGAGNTTITLGPTGDTYIAYNNNSYGTLDYLRVRNNYGLNGAGGSFYDSLLTFDLSSIPKPSRIISATLKLYYYTSSGSPAGRNLTLYKIICPWNENTAIGWSHPWYASRPTSYSKVPASYSWMNWDVKKDIQNYIDGHAPDYGYYGWRITDQNYWGQTSIPLVAFYSKEHGSSTPILQITYSSEIYNPYYCNGLSTNPNLQGNNYNSYTKADWDSVNKNISWTGRRHSNQIDRYFTFSSVYMDQPVFTCDFWADSYTGAGQAQGLINHFNLKTTDGKYIGFGHTMDSDDVGTSNRGVRGEFYNGVTTYYTPWLLVNDKKTYTIKIYIENNMGKIRIGTTVKSVSLSGDFSGIYNSFHFQLGGFPSVIDLNGASGRFDNLQVQLPGFTLPERGGSMVHSTPQQEDFINLPVPTSNSLAWSKNSAGCPGNGVAGNGKIAVCPFKMIVG